MSDVVPWIDLQGTKIPLNKLSDIDKRKLTANERKAVEFCMAWLNGENSFQITTSGSTGNPKTITIDRQAMIASAQRSAKALGLHKQMTSLVCLDTGFIAGMMMLVRSLNTGMNMVMTEPSANPLKDIGSTRIDFTALVPYQLSAILKSGSEPMPGIIILGGAALSPELLQDIQSLSPACYATFGMTETLSHIALQKLNGPTKQENFHTLDGIRISVDDRGCLVINADLLNDTVVTNDLVEIISPKEFKWLGRHDNVINSGGIKVIPEKIEKVVGSWMLKKGVSNRFFATGVAHAQLGQQATLVVEGTLSKEDEHALLDSLRVTLGKYEVPGRILYKQHFTETKTGKIDRRASLA
jgi:O-succinylbenzoic acid--CoA ligase